MVQGGGTTHQSPGINRAAPPIQMNLDDSQTPEDVSSSKTTPSKSRTAQAGSVQSYGTTEKQRDREKSDVNEVLAIVKLTAGSRNAAVATGSIETITSAMEQLLAGKLPDIERELSLGDLQQHIPGIAQWTNVGLEMKSERPLYGYFSDFDLFVAHCLSASTAKDNLARLVLSVKNYDFKPDDSNVGRRVDVELTTHSPDAAVESCHSRSYADMLCNVEAKWKCNMDEDALKQLLIYSTNMYAQQLN
ncbi:hypothetical protein COEREDRAFT_11765 [Coemansia reversa NRRL 1564]|uniref:Uncharacterized protein n=1 Tax=Coemansia reversa (strain ATCC 12441 / NRRL 1564) TaxID=763665 RepID=A0A2G5B265_COERN|nr:hypothetical protein COEREDRAFT_11765 [Coemansia reversa NRRL 1564]|eukprot:PIA13108.1 hypothetical protein COEREDRAFT_11765 [Coemansia reversa NRRL 1564]